MWLVSNIAANSDQDATAIANSQIMIPLLFACRDNAHEVRKEAIWALGNVTYHVHDKQTIQKIVELDIISIVLELLDRDQDSGVISQIGLTVI